MELAAVVMVPGREDLKAIHEAQPRAPQVSKKTRPSYSSRMPILGNDVLRSWMEPIRKLGVQSLWLTASPRDEGAISALAGLARQGIERLLMIKLKSYAEMDLADLLRFHRERRNSMTEAKDARGELGVTLLDRCALEGEAARVEAEARIPYQFRGYAKRILSPRERQELVGDALTGACAMRPLGKQIGDQVWIGEGVELAGSARVIGPTYIGARTIVRAGATIGPFASVERDCIVDCGTTVERSTVLPCTYLAPGLLIREGLVDGRFLEDLGWGAVADLQPAGLAARLQPREAQREPLPESADVQDAESASAWSFAPFSTASQPWLQVQL